MKFGISNEIAQATESTRKAPFEGNAIYDVTFDGCEARSFESNGITYNVLDVKFSDDNHQFIHTIFEPKDGDDERPEGQWGPQPSRMDNLELMVMHLFDATNPAYSKEIKECTKTFSANTWEEYCDNIIAITTPGIGKTMKIKLLKIKKNGNDVAVWPAFVGSFNKEGKLYLKTRFVGENVYFTKDETAKISNAANATASSASSIGATPFGTPIQSVQVGSAPLTAAASPLGGATPTNNIKFNFN